MAADKVAEALALLEVQSQARQQVVDMTQTAISAEIRLFRGWYSSEAITLFAGRLAKLTRAGQRQTALSTDVYASRILRLLLGRRVPPVGAVPVDGLRGVPLETVYGRLADEYRWLHATRSEVAPVVSRVSEDGRDLPPLEPLTSEAILDRVLTRAEIQAEDNLNLAMRDQWEAELRDAPLNVIGYRRIIRPELSRTGTCGLCVVASDQLYSRGNLLPLHGRCRCEILPVLDEEGSSGDPGSAINRKDLDRLYKAAGSTGGRALKKVRIAVRQDRELGPILTSASDQHTKVDANGKRSTRAVLPSEVRVDPAAVLASTEKTIASLERRAAAGEDVSGPLKFQRGLANRMRLRLDAA